MTQSIENSARELAQTFLAELNLPLTLLAHTAYQEKPTFPASAHVDVVKNHPPQGEIPENSLTARLIEAAKNSDTDPHRFLNLIIPAILASTNEVKKAIIVPVGSDDDFSVLFDILAHTMARLEVAGDTMALTINNEEVLTFNEKTQRRFFALQFLLAHTAEISFSEFKNYLLELETHIQGRKVTSGMPVEKIREVIAILNELVEPLEICSVEKVKGKELILREQDLESHMPFQLVSAAESIEKDGSASKEKPYINIFGLTIQLTDKQYHFLKILAEASQKSKTEGWVTLKNIVDQYGGRLIRNVQEFSQVKNTFKSLQTTLGTAGFILETDVDMQGDFQPIRYRINPELKLIPADAPIQTVIPENEPRVKRDSVLIFHHVLKQIEHRERDKPMKYVQLLIHEASYLSLFEAVMMNPQPVPLEVFQTIFNRISGQDVSLEQARNEAVAMALLTHDTALGKLFTMSVYIDSLVLRAKVGEPLFVYQTGLDENNQLYLLFHGQRTVPLNEELVKFLQVLTSRRTRDRYFSLAEIDPDLTGDYVEQLVNDFRVACVASGYPEFAHLILQGKSGDGTVICRINPWFGLAIDIPEATSIIKSDRVALLAEEL